jgi:hypothetical protein
MVDRTPAERRDDDATERDDAAERRDDAADDRDAVAARRDAHAADRDREAHRDSRDLDDRLARIGRVILDRFARVENTTVDPADWPNLGPAGLARLQAHTAEQRRLAALDRATVSALLDDLRAAVRHHRRTDPAAVPGRHAAARDRHHSAFDRQGSAQDRDLSAGDRGHAAIAREQVDPDQV